MPEITPQTTSQLAKGAESILHGKVLDAARWAASVNTVHPSMHRLLNASFLTAGLFGGRKMMDLLVGETPQGHKIKEEDVPAALKPLHGALAYDHFSDHPSDRWMKALDLWIPAVIGAMGAVSGSHVFALDQKFVTGSKAALNEAERLAAEGLKAENLTVDVAERASLMTQAKPWRALSGVTSLFGSAAGFQLIPGPSNYGTTLGSSFLGTVERNKLHTPYMPWLQQFVSANKHPYPYSPTGMLQKLAGYVAHNPSAELKEAEQMSYAILEPWFGRQATPEKVEAFVNEVKAVRSKFLSSGESVEALHEAAHKELTKTLSGVGLEKTFEKIGLDPARATIGRNGFNEKFSRMLGYDKTLSRIGEQYRQGYLARSGRSSDELLNLVKFDDNKVMRNIGRTLAGGSVAAIVAGGVNAQYWHKRDNDTLLRRALGKTDPDSQEAQEYKQALEDLEANKKEIYTTSFKERVEHEHMRAHAHDPDDKPKVANPIAAVADTLNDKPLAMAEWGADSLNSPTTFGMHRVYCAGGLSLGGLIGMKLMEVLTGMTLAGKEVPPEKVPDVMKGIYKKMAYNPHSDHPHDRWGYVAHYLIPGLMATAGVIGASSFFFKDKVQKAAKAEYIDEFETRATMDEAGPWTSLTALTSLFATPAGFGFLPPPAPNYGTALGTRFNLSAGRKVILPVVGDIWTDTKSRYPYGPPRLADLMIKYAVNNTEAHPEQLEEMALGIIKPWFKDASKEQVEGFIRRIEEDRNKFLQSGGIPENMKDEAEAMLRAHFKGAGLEETLSSLGLDPSKATLGQNGLSGKIAEYLGGGDALAKTRAEYKKRYAERQAAKADDEPGKPQEWWEPPKNSAPEAAPGEEYWSHDRYTKAERDSKTEHDSALETSAPKARNTSDHRDHSDQPETLASKDYDGEHRNAVAEGSHTKPSPERMLMSEQKAETPASQLELSEAPLHNMEHQRSLESSDSSRHLSV